LLFLFPFESLGWIFLMFCLCMGCSCLHLPFP
jgi:hypothetical protein